MVVSILPYIDTRSILRCIPLHRENVVPMVLTFLVRKETLDEISDVMSTEDWEKYIKWRKTKTNSKRKTESKCSLANLYRKEVLRQQNIAKYATSRIVIDCVAYHTTGLLNTCPSREVNGSRRRDAWGALLTPYSSNELVKQGYGWLFFLCSSNSTVYPKGFEIEILAVGMALQHW